MEIDMTIKGLMIDPISCGMLAGPFLAPSQRGGGRPKARGEGTMGLALRAVRARGPSGSPVDAAEALLRCPYSATAMR